MSTLEARSGPSTSYSSSSTPSLKKKYLALLENDRLRGAAPPDNDPLMVLESAKKIIGNSFINLQKQPFTQRQI